MPFRIEILEEIKRTYTNAANNNEVTFTYQIERTETTVAIKNDTHGKTGLEPTNKDKEMFKQLQANFMSEISYNHAHGTIFGIEGTTWRIDQQGNEENLHNIQFQVRSNNFANVVVCTTIQPKPCCGKCIDMDMKVFPKHEKAETAMAIKTVDDVCALDSYKDYDSGLDMAKRINKYAGEALTKSLHEKVIYKIRVVLVKQEQKK